MTGFQPECGTDLPSPHTYLRMEDPAPKEALLKKHCVSGFDSIQMQGYALPILAIASSPADVNSTALC